MPLASMLDSCIPTDVPVVAVLAPMGRKYNDKSKSVKSKDCGNFYIAPEIAPPRWVIEHRFWGIKCTA